MSDIGSEDMEDQGPNLGVREYIFYILLYTRFARHTRVDAMKLENDMGREKLCYLMETDTTETTAVENDTGG